MNFTIYTKDNCSFCYKVKQVLELAGYEYVEYNLNEDFTKEEFYEKFGNYLHGVNPVKSGERYSIVTWVRVKGQKTKEQEDQELLEKYGVN